MRAVVKRGFSNACRLLRGAGAAMLLVCTSQAVSATAGPPLARGVNLSQWLEYSDAPAVSAQELAALKQVGFDHVRLPFNPVSLGWKPAAGAGMPQADKLRAAITGILAAGLDVIVDMHPDDATKMQIQDDPATSQAFVALWHSLAQQLTDLPAQRVAFELLNEPAYEHRPAAVWSEYQQRLVGEIRSVLPDHTLILSGRFGGNAEGLAELVPRADPHLIYNFHYYLPLIFTHQGAPWMRNDPWTSAAHWHGVLYPAALAKKQSSAQPDAGINLLRGWWEMGSYLSTDWGRDAISSQLAVAQAWGQRTGARVICDEFGVIRAGVDLASRSRWIADVRGLLEQNRWGWTIWDYAGDFAIAGRSAGNVPATLDPAMLDALGLTAQTRGSVR